MSTAAIATMPLKRALASGALVALLAACAQTPVRAAPQLATADATNAALRHAMADAHANGMAVAVDVV